MDDKKQDLQEKMLDNKQPASPDLVADISLEERAKDPKFLEQLTKQKQKVIPVEGLSASLKNEFQQMIDALLEFQGTVVKKRQDISEKRGFIKGKVDRLVELKQIHLNQQEYKKSELGVISYERLLDGVIDSLEFEINYFSSFLNDNPPSLAIVNEHDVDFSVFVTERVKNTKRYLKTVAKDLQVSYSRYNYGFDEQLKRILYVEALMNASKK